MYNDMYKTYDDTKLDYSYDTIFNTNDNVIFAQWDYGDSVVLTFNIDDENINGSRQVSFNLYDFRYEQILADKFTVEHNASQHTYKVAINDELSEQIIRGIYHGELISYDVVNAIRDKENKKTLMSRDECLLRVN